MHLRWDYPGRKVHLAMPGYVEKALREFLHAYPRRKQYSPFPCAQKKYGKEAQMLEDVPESPPLGKVEQKFIQKVTGKFLYLGRAIDSTLLTPLLAISSVTTSSTNSTHNATHTATIRLRSLPRRCCTNLPCQ